MKTADRSTNPKFCDVCSHPERAEIERLILSVSPNNPRLTLETIADAYGISAEKLRVHALMHSPLALDFSQESEDALVEQFRNKCGLGGASTPDSGESSDSQNSTQNSKRGWMTDKLNLREGDMLLAAANEYLTTLTAIGRRLKRYAGDGSDGSDARLSNMCTTPIVNLYIGAGSEMRKTIAEINSMNTAVNGSHDSAAAGLQALASALSSSNSEKDFDDKPQFLDEEFETK